MPELQTLITGLDFGEGPRWHNGRLWYSDFYQHRVSAVTVDGDRETILELDDHPSGLGWLPDGRMLVVSMQEKKVLRVEPNGAVVEHGDLSGIATERCNDMVVAADGNAYVGNFGFEISQLGTPQNAALALVRPDGTLENRRVWAQFTDVAPDGCTLDAEGAIWVANAFGTDVARVLEGGEITDRVDVGQATYACALGGEDGCTLFLVSADSADENICAGTATGVIRTMRVDVPHAGLP